MKKSKIVSVPGKRKKNHGRAFTLRTNKFGISLYQCGSTYFTGTHMMPIEFVSSIKTTTHRHVVIEVRSYEVIGYILRNIEVEKKISLLWLGSILLRNFLSVDFVTNVTELRCIIIRFIIVYSCVNGLRACHCFVLSRDRTGGVSRQTSRNKE